VLFRSIAQYMSDILGPRFSNSPGYTKAALWAKEKLEELGIKAELDANGEVGPGWEVKYTSVQTHEPQYIPLIAYAKPYSRGMDGKITSRVLLVNTKENFTEQDHQRFKEELRGKIILTKPKRMLTLNSKPAAGRGHLLGKGQRGGSPDRATASGGALCHDPRTSQRSGYPDSPGLFSPGIRRCLPADPKAFSIKASRDPGNFVWCGRHRTDRVI